jgi:hypothetical protein
MGSFGDVSVVHANGTDERTAYRNFSMPIAN